MSNPIQSDEELLRVRLRARIPVPIYEFEDELVAFIKAHSEQQALEARIDELDNIPWKRSDKYGINSPYITKEWLLNRKVELTNLQEQAQLTTNNTEGKDE